MRGKNDVDFLSNLDFCESINEEIYAFNDSCCLWIPKSSLADWISHKLTQLDSK